MVDKVSIGKIIKALRTNKNLTQEELSEKIDISKNYLSKIERGISVLNAEAFLKMADILDFTLEDFGINTNYKINETKKILIEKVLALSDKETKAYSKLLDTVQYINQILK